MFVQKHPSSLYVILNAKEGTTHLHWIRQIGIALLFIQGWPNSQYHKSQDKVAILNKMVAVQRLLRISAEPVMLIEVWVKSFDCSYTCSMPPSSTVQLVNTAVWCSLF